MALVKHEAEAVNKRNAYGQLTTFEVLTALCFAFFRLRQADFMVLEVGMGGTYDATNIIEHPQVCVVTSISLDHTDILGKTEELIAGEKCGIIKPDCRVVTSPQREEAMRVIETVCREKNVLLVRAGEHVTWQSTGFDIHRQLLRVKGRLGEYDLSLPLPGDVQQENAADSVAAAELLAMQGFRISKQNIEDGIARVKWPGRFQLVQERPYLLIDGAHNPYSAQKLREAIEKHFTYEDKSSNNEQPAPVVGRTLIIGTSSDKDNAGIVAGLYAAFDRVIVTRSRHPRAAPTELLAKEFAAHRVQVEVAENVPQALSMALSNAVKDELICATGSLFVVGEVLEQRGGLPD
jgi:dihydrofolate synthase / folylpolyglutamate synthase